jgi:hypothetical protein
LTQSELTADDIKIQSYDCKGDDISIDFCKGRIIIECESDGIALDIKQQILQALKLEKAVRELLEQYDHDYNDIFKITDDKITIAQNSIIRDTYSFAILKVTYTRNELQQLLEGKK